MKRMLVTMVVVGMVFCAFAGGGKENESSQEKTEVSFYTWWGDSEQELGEAIIKEFETKHPEIDIKENYIPYNDYLSKINTLIAAGETPDVFFIQEFLANEWGEKGVVKDLNTLYQAEGIDPDDLYVANSMFKTGENLWAINFGMTTICMFYNKELFAQTGITPPGLDATDPWTWEEYVDAAIKLTKDINGNTPDDVDFDSNNVQTYGTLMPTHQNTLQALLYANGTSIATDDGMALEITKEKGLEVIQNIADLSFVHKCAPSFGATKSAFSNATVMLMNNQLGMLIDGAYMFPNFQNENYDVGVTALPVIGDTPSSIAWAAAYVMGNDTKVEDAAFTFYKYLLDFNNVVDASKKNNTGMGILPHTKSTYSDPELNAKWIDVYHKDMAALTNSVLNDASRVGENVTLKNFPFIVEQTIIPQLDMVWLGEMSAEEALSTLDETLEDDMKGTWK